MNNIKIIYIFPFNHYYVKYCRDINDMKKKMNRLIYSILMVNTNITNNIKIYVDISAYRIVSTLFPFNCELVKYSSFRAFKNKVIFSQKEPFLLLNNFEILKSFVGFKEEYIYDGNVLNENSIDYDVTDKYIEKTLKEIYGDSYNKFTDKINDKINIYNNHKLK